jgi:hypothetical protein
MTRKLRTSLLLSLIMSTVPGWAAGETIMETVYSKLPDGAKITWKEGRRVDGGEKYHDLKIILDEDRFVTMGEAFLSREGNTSDRIHAEFIDFKVNPTEKLKLMRLDKLGISFNTNHIGLIGEEMTSFPCAEGDLSFDVENLRAAHGIRNSDNIYELNEIYAQDTRLQAEAFHVSFHPEMVSGACRLNVDFKLKNVDFEDGLLAGLEVETLDATLGLPANLDSLRKNPAQDVALNLTSSGFTHSLDNGAITFKLGGGEFDLSARAASALPLLTVQLRHGWNPDSENWRMKAWNAMTELYANTRLKFTGLTLQTQNILFNSVNSQFELAGMSTLLSEGETWASIKNKQVEIRDKRMIVGVGDWNVTAKGAVLPFQKKQFHAVENGIKSPLATWAPIIPHELLIEFSEAGALDAFYRIKGRRFGVWLSKLRDQMIETAPFETGRWVGESIQKISRAIGESIGNGPGRIKLSHSKGLTMAQLYTILRKDNNAAPNLITVEKLPGGNAK